VAYVTAVGPSAAQVEYRLTGRHGCATSDVSMVEALPAVEAVRARAAALGVPAESLMTSDRQRQIWARVSAQTDARGEAYRIKASTAQGLLATARIEAAQVYGEELEAAAEAEVDPRIAYRMDSNERPLMWIGSGLREFGIEPGSELTPDQWDMARAMMRGIDPRTGEQLVEPKTAVDPSGKLSARPLVEAIQQLAAERGVAPEALLNSNRKRDAYGRMARGVQRLGDAHRTRVGDVAKLADALKIDTVALYGQGAMNRALEAEGERIVIGNQGYDVTITLPKAYSVLFAFAEGDFAAALESVFTDALTESVQAAERWTAYGMRGHHGDQQSAERVESTGLMGWVNFHRSARPTADAPFGDPHLHGHVTLANMGRGEDGQWSTIAAGGRDLYRHARAIDGVMQARIRAITSERWGIVWEREADSQVWQITGIPEETVDLFSKRRNAVQDLFRSLGIAYTETSSAQQKAAARTLAGSKDEAAATAPDSVLRAYWRAEAEAAEQDPSAILGAALSPSFPPPGESEQARPPRDVTDIDAVARWVFRSDEGLTSHRKDFTKAEALAAVADAAAGGLSSALAVEELTDRVLAHRGMTVRLDDRLPEHLSNTQRYTTADIIIAERRILSETRTRFNTGTGAVSAQTFMMAVATYQAIQRTDNPEFSLSGEQLAVLRRILVDGHGIDAVVGVAGAGKTTIMEVARLAWEADGQVVMGASTAAVAAANLRTEAGITSSTLAMLLQRIRTSNGARGLQGVDVLVLDEAAMVDDRQLAELLAHAGRTGTKVVGIGDPKQLQSPGVGGGFAAVHQVVDGLTLSTNYRQRDAVERRALEYWRNDERREALRLIAEHGRVHATDTRQEAMAAIIVAWQDRRDAAQPVHEQIASTLILAARNVDVDELNVAARAIRRELGELSGPDVEYRLKGGATLALAVGDTVMIRRNDYRSWRDGTASDVLNGFRGVVVQMDAQNRVLAEWREKGDDGRFRLVREWLDRDFIAGGGLSHGIAMTVHKAQGLSVGDVLVYGPGLAANGAYTALSRDRNSVHLFLPRAELEDETTRLTLGEPATDAEELARTVAAFADALETNDGQEYMVVTELGERLEPLIHRPEAAPVETPPAARAAAPATVEVPQPQHADAVRAALADVPGLDPAQVLADEAYSVLDQALEAAADAGLDPAAVLGRAAASGRFGDAESLPVVLGWRVDRAVEEAAAVEEAQAVEDRSVPDAEAAVPAAEQAAQAPESVTVSPGWAERPHGALTDAELRRAHANRTASLREITAIAEQAEQRAQAQYTAIEAGAGTGVQAVHAHAQALQQRAQAVQELAELAPVYEQAGAHIIELRSQLAEVESTMDGRRRGPRERAAAEAAALRQQLEDATRRVVELDVQRDQLDQLAGPEATRAGAVQQWETLSQTLPQMLERAATSDLQDAARSASTAQDLRQRAAQISTAAGELATEIQVRAGLNDDQALSETVERATARLAAVTVEEDQDQDERSYGYDEAQRQQELGEGQGRSL